VQTCKCRTLIPTDKLILTSGNLLSFLFFLNREACISFNPLIRFKCLVAKYTTNSPVIELLVVERPQVNFLIREQKRIHLFIDSHMNDEEVSKVPTEILNRAPGFIYIEVLITTLYDCRNNVNSFTSICVVTRNE